MKVAQEKPPTFDVMRNFPSVLFGYELILICVLRGRPCLRAQICNKQLKNVGWLFIKANLFIQHCHCDCAVVNFFLPILLFVSSIPLHGHIQFFLRNWTEVVAIVNSINLFSAFFVDHVFCILIWHKHSDWTGQVLQRQRCCHSYKHLFIYERNNCEWYTIRANRMRAQKKWQRTTTLDIFLVYYVSASVSVTNSLAWMTDII